MPLATFCRIASGLEEYVLYCYVLNLLALSGDKVQYNLLCYLFILAKTISGIDVIPIVHTSSITK